VVVRATVNVGEVGFVFLNSMLTSYDMNLCFVCTLTCCSLTNFLKLFITGSCDQTECRSNCGCQMGGCKGRPEDGRRPTPMPTLTPFDQGREAGRREANKLWRDAGNRCSSAWGDFQNTVDRKIRARGWNSGGNRSFNQGARAGMKEVVVEKEKECFRDSADECVDLGNAAAREIAYNHCGSFGMNSSKKWRRNCRDAAIDQCRGQVFNQVKDECGSPNTSDLRNLQNKCRNKVLTMIGDRSEDYDYSEDSEDLSFAVES